MGAGGPRQRRDVTASYRERARYRETGISRTGCGAGRLPHACGRAGLGRAGASAVTAAAAQLGPDRGRWEGGASAARRGRASLPERAGGARWSARGGAQCRAAIRPAAQHPPPLLCLLLLLEPEVTPFSPRSFFPLRGRKKDLRHPGTAGPAPWVRSRLCLSADVAAARRGGRSAGPRRRRADDGPRRAGRRPAGGRAGARPLLGAPGRGPGAAGAVSPAAPSGVGFGLKK